MIFQVGVPSEIAASTYGSSRIVSTSERTSRVTRGISGIAIATTTVSRLPRHIATSAIAIRIAGNRHHAVHHAHQRAVEPRR